MKRPRYGFGPALVDLTFPFHFVINAQLRLVQLGPSIQKLLPDSCIDAELGTFFSVHRPRGASIETLVERQDQVLILLLKEHAGLAFRGQLVEIAEKTYAFLGAPWVKDLAALTEAGLRLKHFALHDPVADYLTALHSMRSALADANTLRDALQTSKADLEVQAQKLAKIVLENKGARERAEFANRAKTEFLANVSHEIRTPMSAINGFADLLIERGLTEEMRREFVERIRQNGEHLLSIINDLLDLSRIEHDSISFEARPVSSHGIAQEVFELLSESARRKGLSLELHSSVQPKEQIMTDPSRVRQVLINLVGNAIKFTQEGWVRLQVDRDDDQVVFAVADSGMGVPEKMRTAIFAPFTQVDGSNARSRGGTGLGLTISRRIAVLLDGSLEITRTTPEGATFEFRLPARLVSQKEAGVEPPSVQPFSNLPNQGACFEQSI